MVGLSPLPETKLSNKDNYSYATKADTPVNLTGPQVANKVAVMGSHVSRTRAAGHHERRLGKNRPLPLDTSLYFYGIRDTHFHVLRDASSLGFK
jgi:hypothetical protein